MTDGIRALTFDVFGTLVDWRRGVAREAAHILGEGQGVEADWNAFALAWRNRYQPAMERVRSGNRGFVKLDVLHRENLEEVLAAFGLTDLDEAAKAELVLAWHRLDPWPDTVAGMTRLKQRYILASLSNGNVALIVNMARRGGLPWDAVLGAEVSRAYKPMPEAYRSTADLLGLKTAECLMVAAHNSDLEAAAAQGMRTAYIRRPEEMADDGDAPAPWAGADFAADDLEDLADQLGC